MAGTYFQCAVTVSGLVFEVKAAANVVMAAGSHAATPLVACGAVKGVTRFLVIYPLRASKRPRLWGA
jgi:hypothetical protein